MMWVIGGKSAIGTAHERAALPCQDCWITLSKIDQADRHLIAISDGAGFAKHAESAARISVTHVVEEMSRYNGALEEIRGPNVTSWLSSVRERLSFEADNMDSDLADFSATLLVAMIEGDEAFFWQVGDGGWVIQTNNGIEVAIWPDSGEFINQTVFSVSKRAEDAFTHAHVKNVRTILGFTDGLEHLCLNYLTKAVNTPLVAKLFSALEADPPVAEVEDHLERFLSSILVNERTDDDKTMVLAWKSVNSAHVSR